MFGDGGLNESQASLLACRGFATLALPCFGYEDLPPIMKDLNLDYFEEAAKFVQSHPKVSGTVERNVFKINFLGPGESE